jgi:hypothetical protein
MAKFSDRLLVGVRHRGQAAFEDPLRDGRVLDTIFITGGGGRVKRRLGS